MKPKILPLPTFMRETKRLLKRYRSLWKDLEALQEELLANPTLGTDLDRDLRKVRMRISSKGKGKSGGARVITFNRHCQRRRDGEDKVFRIEEVSFDAVSRRFTDADRIPQSWQV